MTAATPYLKLPLAFDAARMRAELGAIADAAWIGHFNTGAYEAGWRCVPLRSVGGRADHILPLEEGAYQDTHWLARCPYLQEVLASFRCETASVRLMALDPGAVVREHRDPGTAMEEGITRVHVPIATTPQAIMRIEGEVVHFAAGHAWYLNAACLHGVENGGSGPRVHLMIDCVTNDWVRELFRAAGGVAQAPLSADERALLRGRVVPWRPGQPMRGWFPVFVAAGPGGAPQVSWRDLGERRLTAVFFQDSLGAQPAAERLVCHTPLAALSSFENSVAPAAFVFHVSRCGSTLLTQMLATLPRCIVLSEPPVLDAFFRFHHRDPDRSGGEAALRGLLAALGQRRGAEEQHCVVKLDSWHLPWAGWLHQLFPQTPFVLLYRDPAEVLASHRRQRGRHMVPGTTDMPRLRIDAGGLAPGDLDGHAARVLDAIFGSALDAARTQHMRLVNYSQLPGAAADLMAEWGIAISDAEREAMARRAAFHSKHPASPYAGDPAEAAATPGGAHASAAARAYQELEALRLSARAQLREGKMPCSAIT